MADLNELKPVGKLNPFAKFCCTIGNLPTSYMISLTYEEQLLWLCNYLEKTVIPAVNTNAEAVQELQELYIVLKNYVDNYFENLDVQEEINNKLDEMATDGTLENIINQEIFGELNNKVNNEKLYGMKINSSRIMRKIFIKGENHINSNSINYSEAQGFCMINQNICAVAMVDYPKNYLNTNAKITFINLSNGQVLRELTSEFGHANGLAYNEDDGLLYVGGCTTYNENNEPQLSNYLYVINYETLEIEQIELANEITGIAYDKITKKLYASKNNDNSAYIYELDKETYNILNTINLENINIESLGQQNIKINNNIIYRVLALPNTLYMYDIDGNFINKFVFDEFMDKSYYIGELQDIDFIDNIMYFNSCILSLQRCPLSILNIGKTSLTKNIQNINNHIDALPYQSITLYVNNNNLSINPNGTQSNPFNELVEAIMFLNSPVGKKYNANINIVSSNEDYKGCQISGGNINLIDGNNNIIEHLIIKNMSGLELKNLKYKGSITNEPNLYIQYCGNINLYRPICIDNDTGSNIGILIDSSYVNISGYNENDSFDDMIINVVGSSQIINKRNPLKNIVKNDTVPMCKEMHIFEGTLDSINQQENYTSEIGSNNIMDQHWKYKYTYFVLAVPNGDIEVKLRNDLSSNSQQYRVNYVRTNASLAGYWLRVDEYVIELNRTNINVVLAKELTLKFGDGETHTIGSQNLEVKIKKIYFSDY